MRHYKPDWAEHIARSVTNICYAIEIIKNDIRLFLTDHDRDLEFLGSPYISDEHLTFDKLTFDSDIEKKMTTLNSQFNDKIITKKMYHEGFFCDARFVLYRVNWQQPEAYDRVATGILGAFNIDAKHISIALLNIAKNLNSNHSRIIQEKCDAQLADHRCGVDLTNAARHKLAVINKRKNAFEISAIIEDFTTLNDYVNGKLTIDTQFAIVRNIAIIKPLENNEYIIILKQPINIDILPDQPAKITVGCNKSWQTCIEKFDNATNFRGFANMPGKDFKFALPQKNVNPLE